MVKLVSVERLREIEADADKSGLIKYRQMTENAATATAELARVMLADVSEPKVTVLVGPGHNGTDGMLAGLLLAHSQSAQVRLYFLKARAEDDDDMKVARELGLLIATAEDDKDKRLLRNMIASSDLVLDALFGIGIKLPLPLREEPSRVMRMVNQAINERRRAMPDQWTHTPSTAQRPPRPTIQILAVDCPSGLDCDTGALDKNAIAADATITYIAAKPGLLTFPGAQAVGVLHVATIGMTESKELAAEKDTLLTAEDAYSLLPERHLDSNKGKFGRVLIVGGSTTYIGASALCAAAAYRVGAGLVIVGTPQPVVFALAPQVWEAGWLTLPNEMGVIAPDAVNVILEDDLTRYRAMLIGPGLTKEKPAADFLKRLLHTTERPVKRGLGFIMSDNPMSVDEVTLPPLVLDADALNILSEVDEWWTHLPDNTVITPHPGEMARLVKSDTDAVQANRLSLAREKAAEWKVTLVLKGAHTIIASPTGEIAIVPFKTDALAKGGTGDVLAGMIVGLLSQGMMPFEASCLGVYWHGLAGMEATKFQSSRSVTARDVIDALGTSLMALEDNQS